MNENDLEKWVEIIKKHYTTMRGFHPETYKITLGDIEATARFFYDLGLKRAMEEPDCIYNHAPNNPQITVGTKIRSKTKRTNGKCAYQTISLTDILRYQQITLLMLVTK